MGDIKKIPICKGCPLRETDNRERVQGVAPGCPRPVYLDVMGVVHNLANETEEVAVAGEQKFCGRQPEKLEAAIGKITTENRIVDEGIDEDDDSQYVTVARGPRRLLDEHYGPAPRDTPLPDQPTRRLSSTSARPELQVIPGGASVGEVHTALDEAVAMITGLDLTGLREEGATRVARLTNEVDGSNNDHAAAMQAAGAALLLDLRAAVSAAEEFETQVATYKGLTGAE
ncbi:MAG TPA: hypothetical protein VLH86_00580 [Patescibacteria group bacterium]|nr:hypothetical protein [Patescibacteria group bacterium]